MSRTILAGDLDVIFCGLNPATTAATAGHKFSSRSNRFWTVLHFAGFTDVRLQPHVRSGVCSTTGAASPLSTNETGD
jgi:G:T/U-mismatch repair DNA glycosylase